MMKIILNADDFGKSLEINNAIDESLKCGFVNSIGLIVNGVCVQDAVNHIVRGGYQECVHIHFNLSSQAVPLTDTISKDSYFCKDGLFKLFAYTPSRAIPSGFRQLSKWKMVYDKLEAQYYKFLEFTDGRGDDSHIDFHVWYNLSLPVAVALRVFIKKHNIKSARLIGLHQEGVIRYKVFSKISSNRSLKCFPATNIDYFLSCPKMFENQDVVELYCHPEYKDDIIWDNSLSYLHHERQTLSSHVNSLKLMNNLAFVSWRDIC